MGSAKPRRPVLRYHSPGGKYRLASWIIEHFPPHRVYIEPYGGAASVLMRKPRSQGEIYNDLDGEVVNVFRVLRDPVTAAELRALLELTPYARDEFTAAYEPSDDPVEQARRTVVKAFMGFGSDAIHRPAPRGMRSGYIQRKPKGTATQFNARASTSRQHAGGSTGFRPSSDQNGATPANDFATWPQEIPAFVARLQGVAIENKPALDVIEQFDKPGHLIYCDPPYVPSTRSSSDRNGYSHEMTDDDHRALATRLHECEAMVVVSGYPSELYDGELYPDWKRVTKGAYADAKVRKRTEVLWLNAAAAKHGQIPLALTP